MSTTTTTKKKSPLNDLIAGGCAGLVESSICHPLDTIKTRMQLRKNQVESVPQRIRHSLVEPALRFKHSLQDPSSMSMSVGGGNNGSVLRMQHSLVDAGAVAVGGGGPSSVFRPSAAGAAGAAATSTTLLHEPGFRPTAHATSNGMSHAKVVISSPVVASSRGTTVVAPLGPIGTARRIIQREGFISLYKGLSAVYTGIIPKMAIRFVSFEQYKDWLAAYTPLGRSTTATFCAGLASGLTEAVLVVTPAEVCKIRMQSQHHSLVDATQRNHRKYRNVFQTAYVIAKEEGVSALYKGVVPTMLRQGCNQAVNFTTYTKMKQYLLEKQPDLPNGQLPSYQSLLLGGISGGFGPLVNNPLDVVKTRLQKQVVVDGKVPKYTGLVQACVVIAREEGVLALWKGITPRLLRIMPGQAITFMTYEFVTNKILSKQ